MNWLLTMFLIAPLVLNWRGDWKHRLSTRRAMVWCIMLAAMACAFIPPPLTRDTPPGMLQAVIYITIDLVAGWVILRKKPSGCAQKTIGVLFGFMATFSIGFFISSNGSNVDFYANTQGAMGWLQLACLALWGMNNVGKAAIADFRSNRSTAANPGIAR